MYKMIHLPTFYIQKYALINNKDDDDANAPKQVNTLVTIFERSWKIFSSATHSVYYY